MTLISISSVFSLLVLLLVCLFVRSACSLIKHFCFAFLARLGKVYLDCCFLPLGVVVVVFCTLDALSALDQQ